MSHPATLYLDRIDAVIFDTGCVVTEAADGAIAYPSSAALVRNLRNRGMWTAVVCASPMCAQTLVAARVDRLFDVRVDGVDVARLGLDEPPNPALFEEAARRLHVRPARCALIENTLPGIEAGCQGGFAAVVGVDRHGDLEGAMYGHGAHVVVRDLAEVALADGRGPLVARDDGLRPETVPVERQQPSAGYLARISLSRSMRRRDSLCSHATRCGRK